jgi:hypothetical protein
MDAVAKGAKSGEHFRHNLPVHFEEMTVEQYRLFGRAVAKQEYRSREKQDEFMLGWYAINQQFFCFLKDGPKRRIVKAVLTIVCDVCGSVVDVELEGQDVRVNSDEKYAACPTCEEKNR